MSDTFQEIADIPKDFVRDGSLFVKRCTKRTLSCGSFLLEDLTS